MLEILKSPSKKSQKQAARYFPESFQTDIFDSSPPQKKKEKTKWALCCNYIEEVISKRIIKTVISYDERLKRHFIKKEPFIAGLNWGQGASKDLCSTRLLWNTDPLCVFFWKSSLKGNITNVLFLDQAHSVQIVSKQAFHRHKVSLIHE